MIRFSTKGDFKNTTNYLEKIKRFNYATILDKYAREGVNLLSQATPKDSGITSDSWSYDVKQFRGGFSISWSNNNTRDGIPVVILIQYGHATRDGKYIQGEDFINPVMRPLFDRMTEDIWKEVTKL